LARACSTFFSAARTFCCASVKIESRPRRVQLGHYIIFADLDGGLGDPAVEEGLAAVAKKVRELRILGSYPSAKGL